MNIRLASAQKISILNSADIYLVMQQILLRENKIRRSQEHFWVVGLNNQNKILFVELVSLGATNRLQVNPPEVFRMAIYKLAVKIILVHNHPGGTTQHSPDDETMTARMIKAGELINIAVIDHLIITERGYNSFADKGLIESLQRSHFNLMERDKVNTRRLILQAEKEREKQIAVKLKKDGVSVDIIMKATGLKKGEIGKL